MNIICSYLYVVVYWVYIGRELDALDAMRAVSRHTRPLAPPPVTPLQRH